MSGVRLTAVAKSFGAMPVLRGVSLDIAPGEFLTLLGPSGCGKSTLLRVIAGLEAQDSGSVEIAGRAVDALRPKQRDVAMVFQSYALYPHMTVARNIAVPLVMGRLSAWQRLPGIGRLLPGTRGIRRQIETEVREVAASLAIDHLLTRKPGQLSGGQRQRVAAGRAMVRRPAVFLMDEPLSNLDAKLRVQLRAEIKDLHRRLGATFIYVTHDQAEAMTLSDRVAVMLDGELVQVAPPGRIYGDPDDRRVAEFVGSPRINLLAGRTVGPGAVDVAGSILPLTANEEREPIVGIRPEFLTLADGPGAATLSGRIRLVEHLGSDLYVHCVVPGETAVVARLPASAGVGEGETIHLRVQTDAALLFRADGRRLRSAVAAHVPVEA